MSVPSQMSLRRIPTCLHLTIRVAYASAWEALVRTHTDQAVQFIQEFAPRIPPLEALELYFRVVAVPDTMQELVRTRTLTSLEIDTLAPLATIPALRGWQRLRLDLVLEHRRYRRRHQESTLQLARMVGARDLGLGLGLLIALNRGAPVRVVPLRGEAGEPALEAHARDLLRPLELQ